MTSLRIAVLAYTSIANDMRVRRTAEALAEAGHRVTTIGYGPPPSPSFDHVELPRPSNREERAAFLLTQFPANIVPALAPRLHLFRSAQKRARAALSSLRPDVIHANDWIALPAAVAAKRATGAKIVYDSHEFGPEEHADNLLWRIVAQRSAQETEGRLIREADEIITVGEGLSKALQQRYGLSRTPTTILNAPAYVAVEPSPDASPRIVLYHGIVKRGRGIEEGVLAMRGLEGHRLIVRGDGAGAYLAALKALVEESGVKDRVTFEPAVPPHEVVRAAAGAQIGLFCAPLTTGQNRLAMPNKFFEYAMAGLAIVAAKGSDLGDLVEKLQCGVACACDPDAVAAALRNLAAEELNAMRRRAKETAQSLSWDSQKTRLTVLYEAFGS